MHSAAGELTFMPYGKDETEFINSVSRAELNISLMNAAEKASVSIHFNERCTGFDLRSGAVHLRNEDTGTESVVDSEVVIGDRRRHFCDSLEMLKLPRFNFSQQYLDYGYKEMTIPRRDRRPPRFRNACTSHLAPWHLHADRAAEH